MFLDYSWPLPLAANCCPDSLFFLSPKGCLSNQGLVAVLEVERSFIQHSSQAAAGQRRVAVLPM